MQCTGKLYNVHDILSYFCDFWFWFDLFPFFWKTQIDCPFLKDVITHATSSYSLQISSGIPQSVCYVWFSHLTNFGWRQWSCLTLNQSTEIREKFDLFYTTKIYGFGTNCMHNWGWQWIVTLGIWPSETFFFLVYGHRVMPWVCWYCRNLMTWVDP